jgi:hypothetical protein
VKSLASTFGAAGTIRIDRVSTAKRPRIARQSG